MAVVFSKNSGINDDLWKVNGQIIKSRIMDTDTEKNKDDDLVNALFNVKTSDSYAEKQGGVTEMGDFEIVNEGDAAVLDDVQAGYSKLIVHQQFMKMFVCTAEMNEDGDIDGMTLKAANMVRAYKRTRAQFASDALTTEGATFTKSGKSIDKTTGDGLALFSTAHKGIGKYTTTQSNVFTNAFGTNTDILNKLANIGRNFKNDSGHVMGYTFDTIIIPSNVPALEEAVQSIISSELKVGTDYNDINTQKGKWKYVVDHRWEAASGTAPYILMSSEAQKEQNAGVFYDRIPLTVANWIDEPTQNLCWTGRGRFSAGFNTWHAFILGGATTGVSL